MRVMKDSGVPWVGEIPKNWRILRGKNILILLERPVKEDDGVITCFRDGEVTLRSNRREEGFTFSLQEIGYQGIEPGDLVVHGMDGFAGSIGISDSRGKATPVLNVMDSSESKKYLMYQLRTMAHCGLFFALSSGIRVRSCDTNWNKLKTISYLVPPKEEQIRIVSFIDAKCAEIDTILEKTRASIEEYKKLKQSVITEAVTKGICGERPMKDSGVEWIGAIPIEWDVLSFYRSNYIRGRLGWKGLKADEYVLEGYPFLSAFNIIENHLDWSELNFITQERYDESPEIKLAVGDLLIVKDGAGIGKCARIDELPLGQATVNSSLAVITASERFDYRYEYYYMQSAPFQHVIWFLKIGMGVPHLTQEKMREISIPCPTLDEQQEIAAYLDEKCTAIDSLISSKEALITELEVYKKSIIYEYVTGKKEVL